jgi:hypothetical protein
MKTATEKAQATVQQVGVWSRDLLERYECERIRFSGDPNASYERHLVFDHIVKPVDAAPRERFEALARSLRDMKEAGLWIAGTAGDGEQELFQADLAGPLAVVMGSEGRGLRRLTRECCDFSLRLPMQGAVSSLNVSVAAGIVLYEALRQRHAKVAETKPVR